MTTFACTTTNYWPTSEQNASGAHIYRLWALREG
jgi:hypothetical protein